MSPAKKLALGALGGVALGGAALLGGMVATGYDARVSCPEGWTPRPYRDTPLGRSVMTCGTAEEGLQDAKLHLVWTPSGELDDASLAAVARESGFDAPPRPDRLRAPGLEGASVTREHTGEALRSDVYFLSAGQGHGMLSIVYGPQSELARDPAMASWLETVEGTAPWGAPVNPTLRARCPQGFDALRSDAPGAVVRCMKGVGTRAFTVLQLTQGAGGFGTEGDRATLARDVARRVAGGPGGNARVLEEPSPFTAARNVDAIRARFETDERMTLDDRVAWGRAPGSGNLIALYVGPDTARGEAATRAFITPVRASRVSGALLRAAALGLLVAGVAAGALAARRTVRTSSPRSG